MDKVDYIHKLQNMLEEGIKKGVYEKTSDTILGDLKRFQSFLLRNFKTYEHYDK